MSTTTIIVQNPTHDAHYRTTYHMGPSAEAFVEIRTLWQAGHTHHFSDLTRFGDAACHGCGATAWSAWWVADGVFGEGTHEWMVQQDRIHRSLMAPSEEIALIESILGPVEVLATVSTLDEDEPAKVTGRREGIPVPKMAHLRLV